jgi:hypothetical protein
MPQRVQAMGGRNGGAASAGGTGACGPADQCSPDGMNATNIHGTAIRTVDTARQRHPVRQQSPWPVAGIGVDTPCDPSDTIIVSWQCIVAFVICACDCGACMPFASAIEGEPNASVVHASNDKASVRRKNGEVGRGKQSMRRSIDGAKPSLNPAAGFVRPAANAYTAAMPGIDP